MPTDEARGTALADYCQGMGVDVGYGGMSITPTTINVDLPNKRQHGGNDPQHLYGNGANLYWFKNEVLDYVYSSHLLENFDTSRMLTFLLEWIRVVKIGGHIVLYLPDEQRYRAHCLMAGANHNPAHKYEELNLEWFKMQVVYRQSLAKVIYENPQMGKFSFGIVLRRDR